MIGLPATATGPAGVRTAADGRWWWWGMLYSGVAAAAAAAFRVTRREVSPTGIDSGTALAAAAAAASATCKRLAAPCWTYEGWCRCERDSGLVSKLGGRMWS